MQERELLISRCLDAKKKALDSFMLTSTVFLSTEQIGIAETIRREYISDIDTFYFGGFEQADRKIAVYVPKVFQITDINQYFNESPDDCSICLIKLDKDKFSDLSHRDYLGSLMGLGIKREMIGDIIIKETCAYIFALKSISKFICENLTKVGRGSVSCRPCSVDEFTYFEGETELFFASVASLRLDNVVAAAFKLSRSNSNLAIKNGLVYVNSLQITKNDYSLKADDKIVLRGKGKVILEEIIGETKKGRIHINIKKFK